MKIHGALVTLDAVGGPVARKEGLLSRDGWYMIDDTGKDLYKDWALHLCDQDIYVTLNDHPHDNLQPTEDCCPDFTRALGIAPDEGRYLRSMQEIRAI